MAHKFIGYARVMDTSTKDVASGQIKVKLKKGDSSPYWVTMSVVDYRRQSVLK